jgi:hypothetical protein
MLWDHALRNSKEIPQNIHELYALLFAAQRYYYTLVHLFRFFFGNECVDV